MLTLELFGPLMATHRECSEQPPLALPRRLAGLLGFLALGRGRYFSRTEVVSAVWGDEDECAGAGSLNTALWRLRKILEAVPARPGDFIAVNTQGAIGLNGPGDLWLDVIEFEQLSHAGLAKPLDQVGQAELDKLAAAVAIYKGELMSGFTSEWALRARERLRRLHLDALARLMQVSAVRADFDAAIHHAQRILDADVLREDVHRELMRYYVLNGQRAQALLQYETCRNDLKRELAIQPMRETLQLFQRISDAAIGQRELERSLYDIQSSVLQLQNQLGAPPRVLAAGARQPPSLQASQHLLEARRLIAEADRQLLLAQQAAG